MKRFKFRLQRVLDYRQRIRDEKLQILRQRNLERQAAIQHLEKLQSEALRLSITEGSIMAASDLTLLGDYALRIKREIEKQVTVIEEATKRADEAREVYIAASQEARALELLRDKRRTEYEEYVQKEEGKVIDELTVQRFGRTRFGAES